MSIIMYKIIRFTFDDNHPDHKVIKTGLTKEEAQEHCRYVNKDNRVWFDGYTEERR